MPNLIVVGAGIKSLAHLTEETKRIIQSADKVLYLLTEDNLKSWIRKNSKQSESLEAIYFNYTKRADSYYNITNYIIEQYHKVNTLCVVFYGHPSVFASSALDAVRQITQANGKAVILPAVSALDCLFSDLQIDPGQLGCFSIDSTELLLYQRRPDILSHLILWQVYNLGMHDTLTSPKLPFLIQYLQDYYPHNHPVCIYEASVLPTHKPRIDWIALHELDRATITPISTLYIRPVKQAILSIKYLDLLEISTDDYRVSK